MQVLAYRHFTLWRVLSASHPPPTRAVPGARGHTWTPVNRAGRPPQTVLVLADWATLQIRPATAADMAAMLQAVS